MGFSLIFQVAFLIALVKARVRNHKSSDSSKWSAKDWLIFGVIVGICTIISIIIGAWRWYRARKIKRQTNLSEIPQIAPQSDFQQGIVNSNGIMQVGIVNPVPGYPMNPQFPQSGNYPPGLVYNQPGNCPPGSVYIQPGNYPPGLIYPQPNPSSEALKSSQVGTGSSPAQPYYFSSHPQPGNNNPSSLQNPHLESGELYKIKEENLP